jgi:hypothetical protein
MGRRSFSLPEGRRGAAFGVFGYLEQESSPEILNQSRFQQRIPSYYLYGPVARDRAASLTSGTLSIRTSGPSISSIRRVRLCLLVH